MSQSMSSEPVRKNHAWWRINQRSPLACKLLLTLVLVGLAACAIPSQKDKLMNETIEKYSVLVRWSQFDSLVDFIHPDYLEQNPVSSLDIERLRQFRVTNYRVRQVMALEDGSGFDQLVQIQLNHIHTSRERTIQHVESWRWDEDRKRWMLHSGLPDVTAQR